MSENIREFVMAQPLFDAHEHMDPLPQFAKWGWDLPTMAGYASADLVTARGPCAPGDPPGLQPDAPEFSRHFFEAWERSRNTGYCRAIERACRDLFGVEFRSENLDAIRERIAEEVSPDPEKWYCRTLQKRAGIQWIIHDSINMPEQVAPGQYPEFVRVNYRDKQLLRALRSREDVAQLEARWRRSVHSLDQLVERLMRSISDCLATGKVTCVKIGVAYARDLVFADATHHEAERAFSRLMSSRHGESQDDGLLAPKHARLSAKQLRPLEDYLIHQLVRRATDENIPVQIHTGYLAGNWAELGNVNPMQLTTLLRQYRSTRFDLFHSGWPYHDIMAALGKHYPNVWVNMCWSWTMNPSTMERALDAFLDAVPYHKIFAFGGDTHTPFTAYGYAVQAREGIARVLERRIARGDMDLDFAKQVASRIMLDNGVEFHGLKDVG